MSEGSTAPSMKPPVIRTKLTRRAWPSLPEAFTTVTVTSSTEGGGAVVVVTAAATAVPRNRSSTGCAAASSTNTTAAPPSVRNGTTGRLWVCRRSGSKLENLFPRATRSPVPSESSSLTEPRPASTSDFNVPTLFRPRVWALARAARVSNCCRVIRPRSPVGSDTHFTPLFHSRCRERANASPFWPSRT
ncbi:unannotated protein [freshwater metagenome]|uniref:Unannotated protein n=1 Tax=freshwater metagenome TaxID=449393 RepID=A0A6J7URV9_9ZZZZ